MILVPIDRPAILRNAEKLLRGGKIDQAIAEYLRIVEEQPGDWNTANVLGDVVRTGGTDRSRRRTVRPDRRAPSRRRLPAESRGRLQEDPEAEAGSRARDAPGRRDCRPPGPRRRCAVALQRHRRPAAGPRRRARRRGNLRAPGDAGSQRLRRTDGRRADAGRARRRRGRDCGSQGACRLSSGEGSSGRGAAGARGGGGARSTGSGTAHAIGRRRPGAAGGGGSSTPRRSGA